MSDYLANLVAKSRNVANVVQPRPASAFEPPSRAGMPVDNRGAADVESAEERFTSETPFDRAPTTSTPLERVAQPRLPRIDVGPSTGVPPVRGSLASDDARPHPATSVGTSSPMPFASPVTVRSAPVVSPLDSSGETRATSRSGEHPQSVSAPRTEPSPSATVIARERTVQMLGPAPHDRASTSREDTGPTIKISIGRVDVRAVMPPSPTPRPASARRAASLSLDDYLKHQGGGKP